MKLWLAILLSIFLSFIILASCQSRYRPRFYLIQESVQRELTLDDSYYLEGYKISPRPLENLIVPGAGTVLVTNQKSVRPDKKEIPAGLMTVQGEMIYRIVIALPARQKPDLPKIPVKDSLDLADNSLCKLIGRYELPDSLNLYYCREGYLKIDLVPSKAGFENKSSSFRSVTRPDFQAFLWGRYFNIKNDSLQFSGELRVKKGK